jgi:hypothetical protein
LFFQALTARLTNNLAANDLFGADATSLITSSFDSTFHIYKKNKKIRPLAKYILKIIHA